MSFCARSLQIRHLARATNRRCSRTLRRRSSSVERRTLSQLARVITVALRHDGSGAAQHSMHIWIFPCRPSVSDRAGIHREKTGAYRCGIALGIASRTPQEALPQPVLAVNRGHWGIESVRYIIDWHYDEDPSTIRTGDGPANITRLRRLPVGILKSLNPPNPSRK